MGNGTYLRPLWDGFRFQIFPNIQASFCHTWQVRQKRSLADFTQATEGGFDLSIRLDCLAEGNSLLLG